MVKTHEEIKKGLECSIAQTDGRCEEYVACVCCPYFSENLSAEDTLAYIQQLEAQVPKWISVEERLPEDTLNPAKDTPFKSIKVLVAIKAKNGITVRTQTRFKETHYPGGKPVTEWKWRYSAGEVTHWMPLPEGPKEG